MNLQKTPSGLCLSFLVILSLHAATMAVMGEAGYAVVQKVQGSASYVTVNGGGALKNGQRLNEGTRITTGKDSYVDLDLGVNGDALRVGARSTVALTQLTFRRIRNNTVVNTDVEVTRGKVIVNVIRKLSRSSRYRVKTPQWVAGIRGTCIEAGIAGLVAVTGSVEFTQNNGQVQMVIGGFAMPTGAAQAQRATTGQTQGIAALATGSTANLGNAQMIQATVQQFAQAIAAQAAVNAGTTQQATTTASQTAAVVVQALAAAIQQEAANAPAGIRAQVQQVAQAVQQQAAAITVTAAATAAATATIAVATRTGATPAQARQQAQQAAETAAQRAGQTVIQQSGNNPRTATQVQNVRSSLSNVTSGSINAAQNALAGGGTADQAINNAAEQTPSVSVNAAGQAIITQPPAPGAGAPVSANLRGFVNQVAKLSGQTQGQTVGTLAQIMADPFLAVEVAQLVETSQQPGGLAKAISIGGGISAGGQSVLTTLGVGGVGGIATQTTINVSGGSVGRNAATNPNGSNRPPASR